MHSIHFHASACTQSFTTSPKNTSGQHTQGMMQLFPTPTRLPTPGVARQPSGANRACDFLQQQQPRRPVAACTSTSVAAAVAGAASPRQLVVPRSRVQRAAAPLQKGRTAVRILAAAASTVSSTVQAPQHVQQQADSGTFDWLRAWYPVAIVSQLDPARPSATQLLGRHLVIWQHPKTKLWSVFEDRCPHRLAPLSEGRIEPSTGNLMCSYHGWQFDGDGHCTSLPQIPADATAHKTATASKRTCAINYPCQVAQGLLWVWPDVASADQAAVTPPPLTEQWGNKDWTLLGGEWFARDMEYGFDTLMENLFDPSHIPFAHHKIMGAATRDKSQPLEVTTVADVTPTGGFQLSRDTAPYQTPDITDSVNVWKPPCLNCSVQTNRRTGRSLVLTFYGIPLEPGRSRVITAFFTNAKVPPIAQKLTKAFEWVFHLGQNQVLDSDAMLLHVQERMLHDSSHKGNWRSAFFMPASSDTGIIKFRTWYHDCAGGSIPWPSAPGAAGNTGQQQQQQQQQALGPVKPREVVMDRLHQHTLQCKSCSGALKAVQQLQAVTLVAAGVAAAVAIAVVTAAAVTASTAAAAAASARTAAAASPAALGAWLSAVPSWQAVGSAVLALVLLLAHHMLGQLRQRFYFVDYVHAAIP